MKRTGYCFKCNKYQEFDIVLSHEIINVKGTMIECDIKQAVCKECGELVNNKDIEHENDIKVYDLYKIKNDLLTSDQIFEIRKLRGMTQVELANFLSIGEKDIARYENGAIQSRSIDKMIRLVGDDEAYFAMLQVFAGKKAISMANCVVVLTKKPSYIDTFSFDKGVTYGKRAKTIANELN